MAENAGAATVDSSPSLESFVGSLMGDYELSPEPSDETPSSDAPDVDTRRSEGDAPSATPEKPSATADVSTETPDQAAPSTDSEPDPFEGSAPFSYTHDGQSKTFEGITVLKDGAAIVDPEAVKRLQAIVSEREHLHGQGRQDYAERQTLERLTTWTKRDAEGKPVDVTGRDAVWEMKSYGARSAAALKVLNDALSNNAKLGELVGLDQDNNVVWNPAGLNALRNEIRAAGYEAENALRGNFAKLEAPPAPSAPAAPTADVLAGTVDQFTTAHAIDGLTADDKKFLVAQLPRYIVTQGTQQVVDPSFLDVMKDRAALRKGAASQVSTATQVAARNAGKLAAANVGKPAAPKPPQIKPAPKKDESEDAKFDEWFERNQHNASQVMRARI